ncbi:MAG: SDR family NAD(P)-dependent oxidoreductase [Lachnospiraceae bacterium]|nr:SDR family NAD(P)-dependent oxidoreductase [Lachnospiraceae bacterium]
MGKRVVVVSGSRKGIGKKLVEHFLQQDCIVFGCSRDNDEFRSNNYHHAQLDIKDEAAIRLWVRNIKKSVGKIDILVCNAGYAPANLLATMTSGKVLDEVVKTNIEGTFFLCREVAKVMMSAKQGRIITVSSMAAGLHLEGAAAYALSKAAITEFTKILAKELVPFNITCNVIAPSMYMTDGVEQLSNPVIEYALSSLTQKRTLQIEEIYHVIDFFADDNAKGVTGQIIYLGLVN